MKSWIVRLVFIGYVSSVLAAAGNANYSVIPIYQQSAQSLLPALTPLLQTNEKLSANGDQLILEASPKRTAELKRLIRQLDKQKTQLKISVRRTLDSAVTERLAKPGKVTVYATQDSNHLDQLLQVTVQEGQQAFIATDQLFPVRDFNINYWGAGVRTRYERLRRGLYVTPRLHGRRALLSVQWRFDVLQKEGDDWQRQITPVNTAGMNTKIVAPLGQWIQIGGDSVRPHPIKKTQVLSTSQIEKPDLTVFIRVDPVQ